MEPALGCLDSQQPGRPRGPTEQEVRTVWKKNSEITPFSFLFSALSALLFTHPASKEGLGLLGNGRADDTVDTVHGLSSGAMDWSASVFRVCSPAALTSWRIFYAKIEEKCFLLWADDRVENQRQRQCMNWGSLNSVGQEIFIKQQSEWEFPVLQAEKVGYQ